MSEFTIRSESVDVEQIMKQIRARILEKRGADYTEEQIRELASVRLEKFLEPRNLRSDLLEQFRKSRPAVATAPPVITPPYTAAEADIFATHRGVLRFLRKVFGPLLKLMVNLNPLLHVIHKQAEFNVDLLKREARRKIEFDRSRAEWNALYYEVLHNLVLETTRMGIESQNLRMRVESLSSRLDFSERRVRALEGVVQYRPEVINAPVRRERDRDDDEPAATPAPSGSLEGFVPTSQQGQGQAAQGDGSRKRRRRRRGRRGGTGLPGAPGTGGMPGQPAGPADAEVDEAGESDGPDDGDEGDGFDERGTEAVAATPTPALDDAGEPQRGPADPSGEASAKGEATSSRGAGSTSSDDNGEQ